MQTVTQTHPSSRRTSLHWHRFALVRIDFTQTKRLSFETYWHANVLHRVKVNVDKRRARASDLRVAVASNKLLVKQVPQSVYNEQRKRHCVLNKTSVETNRSRSSASDVTASSVVAT